MSNITEKKLNDGAKILTDEVIGLLDKNKIDYHSITWKTSEHHYILTVRSIYGTRFCRFGPISLLEKDPMTQNVNDFLINQLIQKLITLKNKKNETHD